MPKVQLGEAEIHYTLAGDPGGFPVLAIAPGGMRSAAAGWSRAPWSPLEHLSRYRVIAMDQRNAGRSRAPIGEDDGWDTYTADQLALLDHLGVSYFHVVGMCIGGPYITGLIRAAPMRVKAAVMMQPIGLDDNRDRFLELFDSWADALKARLPDVPDRAWARFRHNMFGGDFMFNASPEDLAACPTPILLLRGDDPYHPASISEQIAALVPAISDIQSWKAPELLDEVDAQIAAFLDRYTPRRRPA